MRITELFTAQSIALDEAQQDRSQIIDRSRKHREEEMPYLSANEEDGTDAAAATTTTTTSTTKLFGHEGYSDSGSDEDDDEEEEDYDEDKDESVGASSAVPQSAPAQ